MHSEEKDSYGRTMADLRPIGSEVQWTVPPSPFTTDCRFATYTYRVIGYSRLAQSTREDGPWQWGESLKVVDVTYEPVERVLVRWNGNVEYYRAGEMVPMTDADLGLSSADAQ